MCLLGGFIFQSLGASERVHFCFNRQTEGTLLLEAELDLMDLKENIFLTHRDNLLYFLCLNYLPLTKLEYSELVR